MAGTAGELATMLETARQRLGTGTPRALELEPDDALYRQGDESDHVYVVESGYMKLSRHDGEGVAVITAILNAGEILGPGLYSLRSASHAAIAKTRVRVHRYSRQDFQRLTAADVNLAAMMLDMLAARHEIAERRLHAVLALDVKGRIIVVLHDLVGRYGGRCTHGHEVDVPLTQQEIAELVGATRPVVSSALNELRRAGLLSYSRDHICLDKLAELGRLASGVIPGLSGI